MKHFREIWGPLRRPEKESVRESLGYVINRFCLGFLKSGSPQFLEVELKIFVHLSTICVAERVLATSMENPPKV